MKAHGSRQHKPRVALNAWFLDQPTTGSGQYLARLLDEYQQSGELAEILLCGRTGQPAPEAGRFAWQALRTPFDARSPSTRSSGLRRHLAKLWFEQVAFVRASRRWGADLIHVPYWAGPLYARVPTVVTVHDLIPALLPAYSGGALAKLYTRLVSHSAREGEGQGQAGRRGHSLPALRKNSGRTGKLLQYRPRKTEGTPAVVRAMWCRCHALRPRAPAGRQPAPRHPNGRR